MVEIILETPLGEMPHWQEILVSLTQLYFPSVLEQNSDFCFPVECDIK